MLKNKRFSVIFTLNGLIVCGNSVELSLFYLNNQTPTNYFSFYSPIVEKMFDDSFLLENNEVFQLICKTGKTGKTNKTSKKQIIKKKIANVLPHLRLFISDNLSDEKNITLIAYDLVKYSLCFSKIENQCSLYKHFKNKIFLDFGYQLNIEDDKGVCLCKFENNIRDIIKKFQVFLEKKEKLSITKYRAGEILKNLNGLSNSYLYDNLKEIKNTKQFFLHLFGNIKIKRYTKNDIIVVHSFFSEQTTADIIDMIFISKQKKEKKRKREQGVFIYGETFNFSRKTIKMFLSEIKRNNICSAFNENNKFIYDFLIFLKKIGELQKINNDLIGFVSIKFGKLIDLRARKIYNNFKKLKKKKTEILLFQEKNVFELINDNENNIRIFKFIVIHRMFYFLKYNTFFVIGNNFLTLKERYLGKLKNKFKFIGKTLQNKINNKSMEYFNENIKMFVDKNYCQSPNKKIKI